MKHDKPIYLEVDGETKSDVVDVKINGKTPDKIVYISYYIDPKQRFGKIYIECKSGAFYEIVDFGEIKIKHDGWEITSDYNTPKTIKVKYNGKKISGVKRIRWISDTDKDVNELVIGF